ncbi:MAG TPA: GAF domain-containing sensor histidine kinase [Verrucomicrobiae bacterium]|nr:GAF domain-containing sensor histidine kinase [Verrucomicrobiae bacterium]
MIGWIHDFAPYGVITTDCAFRIQSWNHWMEIHSGRGSGEVAGGELFKLFPELIERGFVARFNRALEGEVSVLSTALHGYLLALPPVMRDSGFHEMQQTARVAPLRYQGQTVGTIIILEDVTQREYQSSVLRRQHERDNILSWALAHLLESQDPRRSIRELFFKVAEQFDLEAYLLYMTEPDGATIKLQAAGGVSQEAQDQLGRLTASSALGRRLLGSRRPEALEDLQQSTAEESILHSFLGFHACAIIPLIVGDEFLGALCLATRIRARLQEGELDLLSTIGQYLAVALGKEATNLKLRSAQSKLSHHAQGLERIVDERTVRLREIISELETFSHTVAHDLRAPIRALTGYCQVLIEDFSASLPAEARDIIDRLHGACQRLDVLTQDLLEFSKISRQEIQLAPVDLDSVLSEALFLSLAEPSSITVRRPLFSVVAHRTLLQQCLSNLIDNAVKFVAKGARPQVAIWTEYVWTETDPAAAPRQPPFSPARQTSRSVDDSPAPSRKVRIMVEDKGIGIPPEAHGKIFGIFERGASSAAFPGSGIGLAIVARAMQRMGGACGVESEVGVGSRFWLELPSA